MHNDKVQGKLVEAQLLQAIRTTVVGDRGTRMEINGPQFYCRDQNGNKYALVLLHYAIPSWCDFHINVDSSFISAQLNYYYL